MKPVDAVQTNFSDVEPEALRVFLKGKNKHQLLDIAIGLANQLAVVKGEIPNLQSLYKCALTDFEEFKAVHARMLELSGKLEDDWNRLKNENAELDVLVQAALEARSAQVKLNHALVGVHNATTDAHSADLRLAELGVQFSSSEVK